MLYAIDATVVHKTKHGTITGQIPTFYLDSNVQGIVDEKHAAFIGEEIVNPTRNKNIKVNVSAYKTV